MISRLLSFSIAQRWLVLLATLGLVGAGAYSFTQLPIDAVPDITNVQVVINTVAAGYSPLEAEQRITFPIEIALSGLPRLQTTRSLSRYGLSQITAIFEDGTDVYFARQLVNERLSEVRAQLPAGLEPQMGPISTGLGEIYFYLVEADPQARQPDGRPYGLTDLKSIQDWIIRPRLRTVPGVVEVNTIGGNTKQYHVLPDPDKLVAYGLTLNDVAQALGKNNGTVGAGYLERNGEQLLVRAPGQVFDLDQIGAVVVGTRGGVPVMVRDVAALEIGHELRTGAAVDRGQETVLGSANLLIGANSRTVARAVDERLREINRSLPAGVHARTVYNRSDLVDATIDTVAHNLVEGALLVIVILFLLLGNLRAALITALVIPLAMLFTLCAMLTGHVSGNLMSLGALDFGIIVDGSVIIVENCLRRLGARRQERGGQPPTREERFAVLRDAALEVIRPSLFGVLIIMAVYLPILTLSGVEGKTFIPMAFTVLAALGGAVLLSLTFVPAAAAVLLGGRVSEQENVAVRLAKALYRPLLEAALAWRGLVVTAAVVLTALCGLLATKLGTEFIPRLDEGDLVIQCTRIPGTSLSQSTQMQLAVDQVVSRFPEVREAFTRMGTADVATDPMAPSESDGFVMLKPRSQWPDPHRSKDDLIAAISKEINKLPGNLYQFSQPIAMRFDDLIAGVRSDLGIKLYGDDLNQLTALGQKITEQVQKVPGASDVKLEQISGLPFLTIACNREALARLGLNVADVQETVQTALGGRVVGQVFTGDQRSDLVVRLPERERADLAALARLPVPVGMGGTGPGPAASAPAPGSPRARPAAPAPAAAFVPLGSVARLDLSPGPNLVYRENGKRRIVVSANVRGRDLGGFVDAVRRRVEAEVKLPPGYAVEYGGQFQNLVSATRRLELVVPVALLLIFVLLYLDFGNFKDAFLVFTGVPLALTGGVVALWLRGITLSISAGIGFIALSGVAVLNGLVLISFVKHLRQDGRRVDEAVRDGALTRLRPVLTTALVASLGFVPMALAVGRGAEVQRPLATVVIGGIISSTALTLLVLPVLYGLFHRDEAKPGRRDPAVPGQQPGARPRGTDPLPVAAGR